MNKVFLGGSRNFKILNQDVKKRLNNLITNNFQILVGDADGADLAIQEFFSNLNYTNLTVYCSGNLCRNNINNWPTYNAEVDKNIKGRKFYMIKDAEMANACDYGFMLWDGKSPGTVNNILNLLELSKNILVYFSPNSSFFTITNISNLHQLFKECKMEWLESIDKKIKLKDRLKSLKDPIPEQLQLVI